MQDQANLYSGTTWRLQREAAVMVFGHGLHPLKVEHACLISKAQFVDFWGTHSTEGARSDPWKTARLVSSPHR
jgi:hypothetical protein